MPAFRAAAVAAGMTSLGALLAVALLASCPKAAALLAAVGKLHLKATALWHPMEGLGIVSSAGQTGALLTQPVQTWIGYRPETPLQTPSALPLLRPTPPPILAQRQAYLPAAKAEVEPSMISPLPVPCMQPAPMVVGPDRMATGGTGASGA